MKFIYLLSACALFTLGSCNDQPKENNTTVIDRKVIEVEAPKTIVVEEKKSTSVKLSPEGGSLKTDKVDIELNK